MWPATFAHLGWEAGDTIQLDLERVNLEATGGPTITGTAQVGETLTADPSGISDPDGNANATYTYQWIASDGTVDSDIDGAIYGTYSRPTTKWGISSRSGPLSATTPDSWSPGPAPRPLRWKQTT